MFRTCALGLAVFFGLNSTGFADDVAKTQLQGVWKAIKCVENGRAKPEQVGALMTVKGNRITDGVIIFENRQRKEIWTTTVKLDTREKQHTLDLVMTCQTVHAKGGIVVTRMEIPGIYRLEASDSGDEVLVICLGEEGGERPTGFDPKKGQTQWTFKRVREDAIPD